MLGSSGVMSAWKTWLTSATKVPRQCSRTLSIDASKVVMVFRPWAGRLRHGAVRVALVPLVWIAKLFTSLPPLAALCVLLMGFCLLEASRRRLVARILRDVPVVLSR